MQQLKINSPATVLEGASYIIRLAVTNRSTKAGVPVGATLGVGISSSVDGLYLIPEQIASEYFAPNETRTFDYTMVAPSGSGGQSGTIAAWIQDPAGRVIAQAAEDVFVEALPPAQYTLGVTVEPLGTGYVTISPSKATYSAGEVVTLTAHPYSGYEFDHWGGWPPYPGIQSTSPTLEITMTADWWVVAAFREVAPPPPPECTPGETTCVGYDLYTCGADEKWQLTEENSTQCGYTPPVCTEGDLTCIGPHLAECVEGKWVIIQYNSPRCEKGYLT